MRCPLPAGLPFCLLVAALLALVAAWPAAPARAGDPLTMTAKRDGEQKAAVIDALFESLKAAKDEDGAKEVANAINEIWLKSGSDSVDLLMRRALDAMNDENFSLALDLLNTVIDYKPDFAEGWNKRATLFYVLDDYVRSLRDVEQTLRLEPRHFGALSGLGLILRELGEKEKALDAFRRALALHPHLEAARKAVHTLADEIEGQEI